MSEKLEQEVLDVKREEPFWVIAVTEREASVWGCPYCGYCNMISPIYNDGEVCVCKECNRRYDVLAGVMRSPFGFQIEGTTFYPTIQSHPRRGMKAHNDFDVRPKTGGEFFSSRGIGLDNTPGCFVCGGKKGMHNNIAAFVHGKTAGERVVRMFQNGARLEFRRSGLGRAQVKIGACNRHKKCLKKLGDFCSDGTITRSKVNAARGFQYKASTKTAAIRHSPVNTLAGILRDSLQEWAQAEAIRDREKGKRRTVLSYPVDILSTNDGYTQQLIHNGKALICELSAHRDTMIVVDLHLAKEMPVGPWDGETVVRLFTDAHGKEVVVPEGLVMPKIVGASITPEEATSWREAGYCLKITFDQLYESGYGAITSFLSTTIDNGLDSLDCCHFFDRAVIMDFPDDKTAQAALARVRKICPVA